MGQKTHPLGIRLKAIENKIHFKKLGVLTSKTLFYHFYDHGFNAKSVKGEKIINAILIERFIINWFSKVNLFTNKIFFTENSNHFFIIIELYGLSMNVGDPLFNKKIFILQKHLESKLLFAKPIKIFTINLNQKLSASTPVLQSGFTDSFKRYKFGSTALVNVGILSNYWPCAPLFVSLFCYFFKRTSDHNKILDFTNQLFLFLFSIQNSRFKGLRLEIKGRVNSADRSQKRVVGHGSLPLQSLDTQKIYLSYGFCESKTSYGVFGVRVFFSYNLIKNF